MSNKKDDKVKEKISFSKCSVLLMYIMVIGLAVLVVITQVYPPVEFIVAWMGFWSIQAIVTAVLEINKRGNKKQIAFWEAIIPFINEENAISLIERYLGIEAKYKKAKKVKEIEEDVERDC